MKFNTIKDMEEGLKKVTNIEDLRSDISFRSQGVSYVVKYITEGSAAGKKEIYYLADNGPTNVRLSFTGENRGINVNFVKVNKF